MAIGYTMPNRFSASFTLSRFRSQKNSGECIPMTTNPLPAYFSCHALTQGSVRSQLIHPYVQNSKSTTLPRSPWSFKGGELSQVVSASSGAGRSCNGLTKASPEVVRIPRNVRLRITAMNPARRDISPMCSIVIASDQRERGNLASLARITTRLPRRCAPRNDASMALSPGATCWAEGRTGVRPSGPSA